MGDRGLNITTRLHERRLTLYFPDLPDGAEGLRLCVIADLHVKRPAPIYDALIEWLRARTFDVGCCAGDLQHGNTADPAAALDVGRSILDATRPRLGWFYVRGNHDGRSLVPRVEALGFRHLRNRSERLLDSAPPVFIAGVDDPHRRRHDLAAALADVPREAFTLLLAHSADVVHEAEARGARLVLCGHTHGGQIRLPWAGALYTQLRVGNEYAYGLVRKGGLTVYTTSGIGYAHVPVRVNCPPEVVMITLRRGSGVHEDSGPVPI